MGLRVRVERPYLVEPLPPASNIALAPFDRRQIVHWAESELGLEGLQSGEHQAQFLDLPREVRVAALHVLENDRRTAAVGVNSQQLRHRSRAG